MEKNSFHGKKELFQLVANGDEPAFAKVHELYKTKLFYFGRRLLNDWHSVEDIVAVSFVALWVSRAQIRSDDHLRNFLFTTVRNKIINYLTLTEKYFPPIHPALSQ